MKETPGVNSANDSNFMKWLVDRLIFVYGEDEAEDFVKRTGFIAEKLKKLEKFIDEENKNNNDYND